jgi:hypothetical protein
LSSYGQPRAAHVYLSVGGVKWAELGTLAAVLDLAQPDTIQVGYSREELAEILRSAADAIAAGNWQMPTA